MVGVIDPVSQFLKDLAHTYFLRFFSVLRTLVGLKERTMLVGIAYIIIYLHLMVADEAAWLYIYSKVNFLWLPLGSVGIIAP